MQLNRSIAFTSSWKNTLIIALIMTVVIVLILTILQPFGSYSLDTIANPMENKNLKLAGYSLCIAIPILGLHFIELSWYRQRNQRWFLLDEILILVAGFLLISFLTYLYNSKVISSLPIRWKYIWGWALEFGLPFGPIYIPLWAFVRYRFSKVVISVPKMNIKNTVTIEGAEADEKLVIRDSDFIIAQAQANYVDIYILNGEGNLEKHVFRQTLSGIIDQVPGAQQIHRSYLVNINHIRELIGHEQNGWIRLNHFEEEIPVSSKFFSGLKEYLQIRPNSSY
ncbi:MAG: LytTR family DNA-binding domain-containing protein [Cyclobacteriaceae bacterium]